VKRVKLADVLLSEAAFGHAVSDLARASAFEPRLLALPTPPAEALADPLLLDRWVEAAADYFGVEAEPVETTFTNVDVAVARLAPGIVRVPKKGGGFGVLVVLESSAKELVVLLPGLLRRRVATSELIEALRGTTETRMATLLEQWTVDLPVPPKAKRKAYTALLHEVAGSEPIGGLWLLRPRPGAPFFTQLKHSGDVFRVIAFVVLTIAQIALSLLGWSSLFDAALSGRLETSPLGRWVLLSLSAALVEIVRSFFVGRLNVSLASILKRRVLAGALHLDPNEIRSKGSGGLLALISEAEVLETAGLGALVSIVSAVISLFSSGFILYRGAGGIYHLGLLAVWSLVIAVAMFALNRRARRWVDFRLVMTNGLVERMVGHRTRMAQERHDGRHKGEDAELELYLAESRRMDSLARVLQGLPSRGWLLLGFVFLLPSLWNGTADTGLLLVAIGGLFQAQSAFSDIAGAISNLLNLTVAWERAGELFVAAAVQEPHGLPAASVQEVAAAKHQAAAEEGVDIDAGAILEARGVRFGYRTTGEQVLKGVSLRVTKGDRILLEGASGGGKSTLAAVLAGLREPTSGMVLHHGLDRSTLGTSTWRRKVSSVPQFHENHILSGSLLFNLLLGRRWPASTADRELAEKVCRSLGLGTVLDRMPAGLEQVVGETGWQLSHGERTRVFLARALLQGAEVILVDESFGALDPHTLRVAIDATWEQAPTLLVIAHP
jgi:ATP-binding cassette subfamily B protein